MKQRPSSEANIRPCSHENFCLLWNIKFSLACLQERSKIQNTVNYLMLNTFIQFLLYFYK